MKQVHSKQGESCCVTPDALNQVMAIYTKHGRRIVTESIRIDASCCFADKIMKIRAVAEGDRKEKVYWVKDLLADEGKPEIQATITEARKER